MARALGATGALFDGDDGSGRRRQAGIEQVWAIASARGEGRPDPVLLVVRSGGERSRTPSRPLEDAVRV